MDDKYLFFLRDLIPLIREKATLAKNGSVRISEKDESLFVDGQLMAYYEILDLIDEQLTIFEISSSDLGLEDFRLEQLINGNSSARC